MELSYKKTRAAAYGATTEASPVTTKAAAAAVAKTVSCIEVEKMPPRRYSSLKWRWQNEEEEKNTKEKAGRSKAERAIEHPKSQSVARRDDFNTGMASSFPTSPFVSPQKEHLPQEE